MHAGRNIPPPSNLVRLLVGLRCLGDGHDVYDAIERGWRERQKSFLKEKQSKPDPNPNPEVGGTGMGA